MNVEKMFTTIDTHVAGEAFRIIVHSAITLHEKNLELNQALVEEKYRHEKELLLNEPRGHRGMNGCIVIPSNTADFACVFVNHDHDVQFKYAGLVASVTALLETGNLAKKENNVYDIDTVNGIHSVYASFENQEVCTTRIKSGACQLAETTDDYRLVEIDQSRSYLIYDLPETIAGIRVEDLASIKKWGMETAEQMRSKCILFDGIVITEPHNEKRNEVRSVTFEKDGSILRSPGIDSTFAILTVLSNGTKPLTELTNYSIFDSKLTATFITETNNRFSVETQGFVTGIHQFIYDQEDPLQNGFLLQ
ncbi:proline racemase family protein [Lentibacillus sp. Marseille-P4043]|uniref:proline racemase family protein n=1 Tax=Lentibacillus sp. Marseille-P4043 TaxID=2040293 RepID=UPI000D0B3D16|nr:proline racemase family protein [Lentibacillus sp. Marseille-P4043]